MLTNRLKIHKDIVISKSYPPSQKTKGFRLINAERVTLRGFSVGGYCFGGVRLTKQLEPRF